MILVPGLLTTIGDIHLVDFLLRFVRGELANDETLEDNLPWGVVCPALLIMNRKCHASPLVPHFGFTQCLRDNSFCFLFLGTIGPSELLVNSRWNIKKSPSNLGSRAENSPKSKVAKSRIIPSFLYFLYTESVPKNVTSDLVLLASSAA